MDLLILELLLENGSDLATLLPYLNELFGPEVVSQVITEDVYLD